jgi:hypothetical protein
MHDLGAKLRARYGGWLRAGVPRCAMKDAVRVLSTNTQVRKPPSLLRSWANFSPL